MNIVFLLDSTFPYYTGGRETWLYQVSQRLCEKHRVTIFSMAANPKSRFLNGQMPPLDPRISMVSCFSFAANSLISKFLRSYLCLLNQFLERHFMKKQLFRFLEAHRDEPIYLISMDTVFTATIGMEAKRAFPNVQFINSVRGPHAEIDAKRYPIARSFFLNREMETLQAANQVWSNGLDTQAELFQRGIYSTVVRNGVDCHRMPVPVPDSFFPQKTDFHLLSIGSLLDIKGYPQMIRAIAQVKDSHGIRIGLTIFGKGSPIRYQKLASELGIAEQILFAGFQSQTVEYASGFDGIACLSGGGGQSMACLESLLSGTPVIAWDSPIYRQMITHLENGFLVEEWNVSALADGLVWLCQHEEARKQLAKIAKTRVELFDWSHVVETVEKLLEECD